MIPRGNTRRPAPKEVYEILYDRFGPQGWWPVTERGQSVPRYNKLNYSGKSPGEKFEICAGAILTQNTAWKNVEKALSNLNRAGVLSPEKIPRLSPKRIVSLLRPSGYYNQKAERLKGFARYICANYGGDVERFFDKTPVELRKELLELKGVGPETADSIILYAAEKPSFVIDAYTLRVGRRLGWFGDDTIYDEAREYLVSMLPRSLKVYNEFHALMVALGKDFCRKSPLCAGCSLKRICSYEKNH